MNYQNHFSENDGLKELGLSVRAYNYCLSRGISTIKQLLDYYSEHNNSIPAGQNAGYYTISELARKCKEILESSDLDKASKTEFGTISEWHVSVRAYNVLQSYRLITKQSLLQFYYEHGQSIPDNLRNCGRKTIQEIEELCRFLLKSEGSVDVDTSTTQAPTSNTDHISEPPCGTRANINRLRKKFSRLVFLDDTDIVFLSSFYEEYGHYPLLWLLSKYIEKDDDVLCFACVYGIDLKKGITTPSELAQERNVTRSRIRMRVSRGLLKLFGSRSDFNNSIKSVDNEYLINCLGQGDFISSTDRNTVISDINKQEGTYFTNEFILKYLSVIFKGYKTLGEYEGNKARPEIIVLSKNLCSIFNFDAFFNAFDSLIEDATNEFYLNLRELIEDSPCWTDFSIGNVERVLKVAKAYALSRHGLYEEFEKDTLHILPKKYDIAAIVYSVVSEAKAPLTIQDIIRIASEQYPLFPFPEDAVRTALREDTRIQYKRAGALPTRYLLASSNAPTSIRDAVVKVLSDSETPLLLDDIVSYVLTHFPSSTKNSIRTSLLSDGQGRFIQFEGGRYGLASQTYSPVFVPVSESSRLTFSERLILLKKFIDEKHRFPSLDSSDSTEVDFAKWIDRNRDRAEVQELINTYALDVWKTQCTLCEYYIVSHKGKLPPKDREPELFKWLFNASMDMREDRLNQEQRRLFLHLKMQIRQ